MQFQAMQLNLMLILACFPLAVMATEHHRQLIRKLLTDAGYDPDVRPVANATTVTDVSLRLNLHQIRELLEKEQVLITLVWLTFRWKDEFLTWNSSQCGGVDDIHIKSSRIWKPDVMLYNNVDGSRAAVNVFSDTNAIVFANGSVFWETSALLKSSCKLDIAKYPFDEQRCFLNFGSWTNTVRDMNLTCEQESAYTGYMVFNSEWSLLGIPCGSHELSYPGYNQPISSVFFTLIMKRLPMFYLYNLLFPALCLFLVGSLVFLVPPDSGEKVSLGVTVLLAMTVFMLIIMENIPVTSEVVPWLEKLTGSAVGLLSLSTIMSVLVVNCHYQGNRARSPPPWIQRHILGSLRRLLRIKKSPTLIACDAKHSLADCLSERRLSESCHDDYKVAVSSSELGASAEMARKLGAILREIQKSKCARQEVEAVQGQWSEAAHILDRLFLYIFILFVCIMMIFSLIAIN